MTTASDSAEHTPEPAADSSLSAITFPNGNQAYCAHLPSNADAESTMKALAMPTPHALIMLSGGAGKMDDDVKPRLFQLFSRAVVRAAHEVQAAFVSGGTDSGVMAILGKSLAERRYKVPLVGVVPECCVTFPAQNSNENNTECVPLEPNHTHFLLVQAKEWGAEVDVMYNIAQEIKKHNVPAITILVNGGNLAKAEVVRSVRLKIPVLVIEGSGRLADEIANLYRNPPEFIEDPLLAEIMEEGELHFFSIQNTYDELERLIFRLLRGDTTLKLAWEQFAVYDLNANLHRDRFRGLQWWIIILGVAGTFFALVQNEFEDFVAAMSQGGFQLVGHYLVKTIQFLVLFIPIAVSLLLAAATRFNSGTKWLLLRASAEAIKREIFTYRIQAAEYSEENTKTETREVKLSKKLQIITNQLMQTDVNVSALHAYKGVIPPLYSTAAQDDGISPLTPERYLNYRLEDQLSYYLSRTNKTAKQFNRLQWITLIVGGIGTLLAAVGLELWIALTTSVVAAIGSYMEQRQLEDILRKSNQAAASLSSLRHWWIALSPLEQAQQKNITELITQSEDVLQSEFAGWMDQMKDALTRLKDKQEKELEEREEKERKDAKESSALILPVSTQATNNTTP